MGCTARTRPSRPNRMTSSQPGSSPSSFFFSSLYLFFFTCILGRIFPAHPAEPTERTLGLFLLPLPHIHKLYVTTAMAVSLPSSSHQFKRAPATSTPFALAPVSPTTTVSTPPATRIFGMLVSDTPATTIFVKFYRLFHSHVIKQRHIHVTLVA